MISFLPVFFLTGRDYRLFSPLAWTKTYALVASLIVAVTVVPALSRIFLTTSKHKRSLATAAAVGFGAILFGLSIFVWGPRIEGLILWPPELTAALIGLTGGLLVFWLFSERVRPVEANPVARAVNFVYAPTLRLLLRHKKIFLMRSLMSLLSELLPILI